MTLMKAQINMILMCGVKSYFKIIKLRNQTNFSAQELLAISLSNLLTFCETNMDSQVALFIATSKLPPN